MARVTLVSLAAAALVSLAAAALVALASGSAAQSVRPALRVADRQPLTVVGSGFRPHEHVRVVVRIRRSFRRETDASAAGSFRVRFPRIRLGACTPYSAHATGHRGSRAVAKPTLEACGTPPGPIR